MFKVGDKVRVRTGLEVEKKYGIIECSKDHIDAHGMEGEVTEVFGDGIGYQVSFDPSLTFDEEMLDLMETAPVKKKKSVGVEASASPMIPKRQIVSERLRKFAEMTRKLEETDKEMFFGLLYDKLESILYETYGE